jgi:hypothetical protein
MLLPYSPSYMSRPALSPNKRAPAVLLPIIWNWRVAGCWDLHWHKDHTKFRKNQSTRSKLKYLPNETRRVIQRYIRNTGFSQLSPWRILWWGRVIWYVPTFRRNHLPPSFFRALLPTLWYEGSWCLSTSLHDITFCKTKISTRGYF